MTIPDELVQAGAEALCVDTHPGLNRLLRACEACKRRSRLVLQPSFAKLPECEAAREAVANSTCDPGCDWPSHKYGNAVAALTALAREFGGQK